MKQDTLDWCHHFLRQHCNGFDPLVVTEIVVDREAPLVDEFRTLRDGMIEYQNSQADGQVIFSKANPPRGAMDWLLQHAGLDAEMDTEPPAGDFWPDDMMT